VDLERDAENTKYMFMSRYHNVRQKYNIKVANKFFENVTNLRCLGKTIISLK